MHGRLLLAVAAAAVVVLASPFVGEINTSLQRAFPGQYVGILVAAVVLPGVVAIAAALVRVTERRPLRYALLVAAVVLAVAYARVMETTRTEQFHFTEYGGLAFLFYRAWHWRADASAIVLPVCAATIAGFADEWFQWFVPSRVGEARDVVLNAVGVVCGLLVACALNPLPAATAPLSAASRRTMAAGLACTVLVGALFFQTVHLGYEAGDGEAGTFLSRYTTGTLRELSAARAERWRADPPRAMPLISREDHFLSEGRFHVERRNTAAAAGDAWTAWQENLILERYYRPVLESGVPGSRWPDDQREQIRAAAAAGTRSYVSQAYPFPMYPWNRMWFWGVTLSLIAALWLLSR